MKRSLFVVYLIFLGIELSAQPVMPIPDFISKQEQTYIVNTANAFLDSLPVTVTAYKSERSEGSVHDFYSEGDYWWPDPNNPDGPYIQRDGQTNPDNFVAHRHAMIRLSRMVGMLTSAYLLTGDQQYVKKVRDHLDAWFIKTETHMNPSLNYAQAIKGRVTGRGIGIIDAIHLIEVARAAEILKDAPGMPKKVFAGTQQWFGEFLDWLFTHPYGKDEMNTKNNHATCWVMQAAAFAHLTDDEEKLVFCRKRFKDVLLPNQMAEDGSFPLELERTKPYGYSLFNIDAMTTICHLLSTPEDDLWHYILPDGRSIKKGVAFIYPYIKDKSQWPYEEDVMYWDEWPVRHPTLLFAGMAYDTEKYIDLWKQLDGYPTNEEVIRNLPIRNPLLWINYPDTASGQSE